MDRRTRIAALSSPGRVFDCSNRFKIIQKVGEGGMSAIDEVFAYAE